MGTGDREERRQGRQDGVTLGYPCGQEGLSPLGLFIKLKKKKRELRIIASSNEKAGVPDHQM